MFEKEAEEYIDKLTKDWFDDEYSFSVEQLRQAILHFAEFGYNKANEWHYVKDGDLPIFETELLCQKYSGRCFVGYYHYNDNKFYPYEKGNSYDVTDVIAWKEIVLPKEIE